MSYNLSFALKLGGKIIIKYILVAMNSGVGLQDGMMFVMIL